MEHVNPFCLFIANGRLGLLEFSLHEIRLCFLWEALDGWFWEGRGALVLEENMVFMMVLCYGLEVCCKVVGGYCYVVTVVR